MAVDPLNPALPTSTTQVEVAAELRAIKGRLVTDKTGLETLQALLSGVSSISAYMKGMLPIVSDDLVLDYLGITATGKDVLHMASLTDLADALGVTDYSPDVDISGVKSCISFGELKFNMIYGSFSDLTTHSWRTAFDSVVLCVLCTKNQNENGSVQAYNISTTGCDISFNGGGTKAYSVLAIGI